ncbi:MAG: phosphoribosylformylglycinamidine synthase [Bacteroidales bacterium]
MISFFNLSGRAVYAVDAAGTLSAGDTGKLIWLFGGAEPVDNDFVRGTFIGPRKEMITPWSTNAVEITQNMGISGIRRIEQLIPASARSSKPDPMLEEVYQNPGQDIFTINRKPEPVKEITDIAEFNRAEGLALSNEEIAYLENLSKRLGRHLTDSEVFGFSQVNSEHCRHKIFNGTFILDGKEMPYSLFDLIRRTSKENPNFLVSAYKDNVAFISGPDIVQFAPRRQDIPEWFMQRKISSVLSLKAETHNFPTTVEPFNGAATGTGGEIRDRMAGGKGSLPLAGTAVYMTSYSRLEEGRIWEKDIRPREWLYQSPESILIKASNGASDFGNKFGQPLICGSVLTFEYKTPETLYGYDKVIMLAGGIGFGKKEDAHKGTPQPGDRIIVMGGDNYRIGMGGGAVSSVATGEYSNRIELNAVQRSNPEMQKRVYNAIRAMAENEENRIVSIHDHGAGGHLNSLSELVEESGGKIDLRKLPVGDPTLSAREIIGNESQERMGLIMKKADLEELKRISDRERAPLYDVGEATGDHRFTFADKESGRNPMDLELADLFGNPPKTILEDKSESKQFQPVETEANATTITAYLKQLLQMEAVGCKDWLTNKVDRSVTGRIALQQTCGEIQLPLNNAGVVALDYHGKKGIATSIGHAPGAALIHAEAGSRLAVAEALTNIVWTPLSHGLKGVSLSANWMWPAKNPGENSRLYRAVESISNFAVELGINIPTGKDSLSMTQKYPDGSTVISPGTVIVSAAAEVSDIGKSVTPVLKRADGSAIVYIPLSDRTYSLGGSSFAQLINRLGDSAPDTASAETIKKAFSVMQDLIIRGEILAGHDVSAGGLITTLLEMTFATEDLSAEIDFQALKETELPNLLFSEAPGWVIQVKDPDKIAASFRAAQLDCHLIGKVVNGTEMTLRHPSATLKLNIPELRDLWFRTSYLLDIRQSGEGPAQARYKNYSRQKLEFRFPESFTGDYVSFGIDPERSKPSGIRAAIIREKGVNGDREMAWSLYLAGFDVKDVHMTDLISGRETLDDISMIVFVGGFSNSDVLGSARGWAGAFLYNPKAREALDRFYNREDTLSLGICNGCQLMMHLGLVTPQHEQKPEMLHNKSGKFESAFLTVDILPNHSVMLRDMEGSRLGIWVAHGEGRFRLPYDKDKYHIPVRYSYSEYPGNPNGSDFDTAAICSEDGRHLAMMPHLERAVYPWQWAYYPDELRKQQVTPWIQAFVNARLWIENIKTE